MRPWWRSLSSGTRCRQGFSRDACVAPPIGHEGSGQRRIGRIFGAVPGAVKNRAPPPRTGRRAAGRGRTAAAGESVMGHGRRGRRAERSASVSGVVGSRHSSRGCVVLERGTWLPAWQEIITLDVVAGLECPPFLRPQIVAGCPGSRRILHAEEPVHGWAGPQPAAGAGLPGLGARLRGALPAHRRVAARPARCREPGPPEPVRPR